MIRRGLYQLELAAAAAMLIGVGLVSLLAGLGMANSQATSGPVAERTQTVQVGSSQTVSIPPKDEIHYIGLSAGSCATANCHGGVRATDQAGDEWKTSAFVFLQTDPHAQAFDVLFDERSQKIVSRLAQWEAISAGKQQKDPADGDTQWYTSQLQAKCVSCHATPVAAGTADNTDALLTHYSLGVTCEACHGPASHWGNQHLSSTWKTTQPTKSALDKQSWGFNELENPSIAAATCTKCHIGDGSQVDGKSRREVTHDLIAAGHPRLDFDFAAWYGAMPPHWNRAREKVSGFHTEAWLAGQTQNLQTRGRLSTNQLINPEFANFDCFACHQALRFPPRATSYPANPLTSGSSWKVFTTLYGDGRKQNKELTTTPVELCRSLSAFPGQDKEIGSFDELASWYYAADAVSRDAMFAAVSAPALEQPAKIADASLRELKSAMEKYLAPAGEVSRYASPAGFGVKPRAGNEEEPEKAEAVQTAFEEARAAMKSLADAWRP